mmetsp:Transcript_26024/g.60812  ORF Transcript_26024/g.60812 Transcript_26024/m.60812 type:complete len:566 (-) Transcript_26024:180-1877(-)
MGHRFYKRTHQCAYLLNLTAVNGSVFPSAFAISIPCGIISALLVVIFHDDWTESTSDEVNETILTNSAIWSSFSFITGFLVVFRTSHAFNRFWEALTSTHKMGAEWFEACSALISFSKGSSADLYMVQQFHNKVIRLFSMMHACAIAELEDMDRGEDNSAYMPKSFHLLELLDAGAFEDKALRSIMESDCRVELIYQWIQHLIMESSASGVLAAAPPILTRAFQEMSAGMVCFNDAMKIADTPFPFPYAQTCDALLLVQYICAPVIVATYVRHWAWAGLFTFVYIFAFWALTLTGLELEFPFGKDANDIDTEELQRSMNHKLQLLVTQPAWSQPKLHQGSDMKDLIKRMCSAEAERRATFLELWGDLDESGSLRDSNRNGSTAGPRSGSNLSNVKRRFSSHPGKKKEKKLQKTASAGRSDDVRAYTDIKSSAQAQQQGSGEPTSEGERTSISDKDRSMRPTKSSVKNRSRPARSRTMQESYVHSPKVPAPEAGDARQNGGGFGSPDSPRRVKIQSDLSAAAEADEAPKEYQTNSATSSRDVSPERPYAASDGMPVQIGQSTHTSL